MAVGTIDNLRYGRQKIGGDTEVAGIRTNNLGTTMSSCESGPDAAQDALMARM
jgi:hypothetical protein